jgi:hypothetical protein
VVGAGRVGSRGLERMNAVRGWGGGGHIEIDGALPEVEQKFVPRAKARLRRNAAEGLGAASDWAMRETTRVNCTLFRVSSFVR